MPHSIPSCIACNRRGYIVCLVICLMFLSILPVKAELLYNRPIKTDIWKGAEIEYLGGTVIVRINSEADSAAVESLFAAHDCYAIHYSGWNGWALAGYDTSASLFHKIDSLNASPLINLAEPNGIGHPTSAPNDPLFTDSLQWSLWNTGKGLAEIEDADIDALEAWEIEAGDTLLIIAVLDTGFPYNTCNGDEYEPGDYCHDDLSDESKYIFGYDCSDSVAGCISVEEGGFLADEGGPFGYHGTAVTSIISAMTNNLVGMAGTVWDCKVYVMKLYPSSPNDCSAAAYNVSLAMNLAVDYGAKIINLSSGWYCDSGFAIMEQAVERADSAKCLLVATTGNDLSPVMLFPAAYATHANREWNCCDPDTEVCPEYPDNCGHRNVIAVGASSAADTHMTFSNYGTDDYKVTLLAPSDIRVAVLKTYAAPPDTSCCFPSNCTGNWQTGFSGTSASAPHVSGVAGLLQSYALAKDGDFITPDSVRTLIEWTADDIETDGWDQRSGFGRINALRALMAMDGKFPNATGYLRANATWGDSLGDTLYVLGDVVIPDGYTVTIKPGTVVKLLDNDREDFGVDSTKCEIIVQGTLVIDGGPDSLIQLVSCGDSPSDSDWYGIKIDSTGSVEMEYCVFEDAAVPLPWDSPDAYTMNHVTFRHCQTWPAVVDSAETLRVVGCAKQDFDTAVIVNSWGALSLDSCHLQTGEIGVLAESQSSVRLKECEIRDVATGIYFSNSASDSVLGCTFRDNILRGIIVPDNDNMFIDGCIFVDSTGSDTLIYGIHSSANITVKNSYFQGYEYGIKVLPKKGEGPPSPLIEDCGFYNIGKVGIWAASGSDPTIKKCCFKGSFEQAGIEVDGGNPYISRCYMASENDEILMGMLFTGGATGTIRKTAIWDYDSCAVEIVDSADPDFGNSDSIGCNWFEEPAAGRHFFRSYSDSNIVAKSNYWEIENQDTIAGKIVGDVDIEPILGLCDHCFPYYSDQCSGLPPSDPSFEPCKIAVTEGQDSRGEEEKEKGCRPREFALSQNYPNPFNPQTVIKYDLPEPVHVRLTVYNALGQKVRTLVDERQGEGYKTVIWDGSTDQGEEVASGIYFFRLQTGSYEATKKMILLR